MWIDGKTNLQDNFEVLYQDGSSILDCSGIYGTEGTSPCDDVLIIPISNTQLSQYIRIAVANYLQLCEVQIFAGKQNAHVFRNVFQFTNRSLTLSKMFIVITKTNNSYSFLFNDITHILSRFNRYDFWSCFTLCV